MHFCWSTIALHFITVLSRYTFDVNHSFFDNINFFLSFDVTHVLRLHILHLIFGFFRLIGKEIVLNQARDI